MLRKKSLHTCRPTGNPRFSPEVPPAMMCGVKGDIAPPICEFFVVAVMYTIYLERSCGRDLNFFEEILARLFGHNSNLQ